MRERFGGYVPLTMLYRTYGRASRRASTDYMTRKYPSGRRKEFIVEMLLTHMVRMKASSPFRRRIPSPTSFLSPFFSALCIPLLLLPPPNLLSGSSPCTIYSI